MPGFKGKTMVITGGAHGIGKAIPDAFRSEGAAVYIIDTAPGNWFIYLFQNMFYNFLQNGHRKEYRAAVALLREVSEENKKYGKAIQYKKSD